MWRMLQQDVPDDYVIATGESHTLESFVANVFSQVGLNWRLHVDIDPMLFRPSEIINSAGCSDKAKKKLDWMPAVTFQKIIANLVDAELKMSVLKS